MIPDQVKNKILKHIKHCDSRINQGIPHYDECEDFRKEICYKGDRYKVSINISRTISICRNGEVLYQGTYVTIGRTL